MARWTPAPIVGGAYKDDTRSFSVQDTVNWIPERAERPGGRAEWMLRDAPGARVMCDLGSNAPIRGLHNVEGLLLAVSGNTLYKIAADDTASSIGTIPGVSRVSMAHNQITGGNEVLIANGQSGYVYNSVTDTVAQVTDVSYPGAIVVDYVAQVMPQIEPQRRYWFHSDVTQATQYLSTDQYEAESAPDLLVTLIATHGQLLVLGDRTGEFYEATGGTSSFFERMQGTTLEIGCASAHAACRLDSTVYWVGSDGCGYRLVGYNAQRITTHAIEQAWARCDLKKAFAFTFEDRGHKIWYVTFPDGETWGYDVATQEWHRRKSQGMNRWRMNALVYWNGHWIGGDYSSGRLYRLDWEHKYECCDPVERERISGVLHDNQNKVGVNAVELVFETGGVASDPPTAPLFSGDLGDGPSGEAVDYQYPYTADEQSTIDVISGALPDGLSMDGTGHVTGTRTTVGGFAWVVRLTDSCGNKVQIEDFSNTWGTSSLDPETGAVKYQIVEPSDTTDYSSPSLDDSAWATGLAPFGNIDNAAAASVGFALTPVTAYPLGKTLWYRTQIYLASITGLTLGIFADDEGTAWVNGVAFYYKNSGGASGSPAIWYTAGVVVPEANLVVGWNDLCFRSRELFGGQSYFDYRLDQPGYVPPETPASAPSVVSADPVGVPTRTVQIRYSKDGGNNYSGWVDRSLGEVGDFMKRVKLHRLSKGLQWVFDIRVTSPIPAHLIAAAYKLEGADS